MKTKTMQYIKQILPDRRDSKAFLLSFFNHKVH